MPAEPEALHRGNIQSMRDEMTRVLHRSLIDRPPVAKGANGVEIIDSEGRRYIDACGGAAVSSLGHAHPDVIAAMHAQIDSIPYAHTGFFTTEAAEELAADLIDYAPNGLSHVYLASGGSEAVEAALKMARQYFVESGQPERRRFIARRQSFHGNTLGALAVGGNLWRRKAFEPLLIDVSHVSPCYEYRGRDESLSVPAYVDRLAQELEHEIQRLGPRTVAAFVAETVVGATLGAVPAVDGYFRRIREVCDRHGILLVLDEIMCGMGRTGTLYACEPEGVVPDLITIAKGLGGGYAPIGALLVSDRLVNALAQGSGAFLHGHTYNAHPVACAAALAVQRVIRRDRLLENVRRQGARLEDDLRGQLGRNEFVGDIRGRGLLWGVELVKDRSTKETFSPRLKLHSRVKSEAMKRGLAVYPMGGTLDGERGDHILIAPPFIADAPVIDRIVERLSDAIDAAMASVTVS
jgi:adenosylmethionine-8-amino-7-oxononanoate aminotransferase